MITATDVFSVYKTEQTIEIHRGCNDYQGSHLICTTTSYEAAYNFAQAVAQRLGKQMVDSEDSPET